MATIDKANMNWEVTRIALAKMISNYALKNLKKKWDTIKKCIFADVDSDLDKRYDNWVTNACQLWLMGQWITKFRPYDKVTVAEIWTILSRLLYWDKYNWGNPYYIRHLNKLKIVWIMSNTLNPDKKNELRGNVMVMLKRSELWGEKTVSTNEVDDSAFMCYECYLDWCVYEPIERQSFILPYKNWYIWIHWDMLWVDGWIILTYRALDDPCEYASYTDSIYYFNRDTVSTNGCVLYNYYSDWKLTTFSSSAKDILKCRLDTDKYFINVLNWKEENKYISFWLKEFKKAIDKGADGTWLSFRKEFYSCMDELSSDEKDQNTEEFMANFDIETFKQEIQDYNTKKVNNWIVCIDKLIES